MEAAQTLPQLLLEDEKRTRTPELQDSLLFGSRAVGDTTVPSPGELSTSPAHSHPTTTLPSSGEMGAAIHIQATLPACINLPGLFLRTDPSPLMTQGSELDSSARAPQHSALLQASLQLVPGCTPALVAELSLMGRSPELWEQS